MNTADYILEAAGSVFDGLTQEKAEVVNGAFFGCRCRVMSKRDATYGAEECRRHRNEEYIFLGLTMPYDWSRSPFQALWDLELQKSPGILRIISPALITHFELVDPGVELLQCQDCLAWQPRSELRDFGLGFNSDFEEQEHLRTKLCCKSGGCE